MMFHQGEPLQAADAHIAGPDGTLVITLYRCAMAGCSVGQTECWEIGWRALGQLVPPSEAGALFGEFYGFVRALLAVAQNPLSWRQAGYRGLCNDEALALSMVGAAQAADTVGLLATAAELLGVEELGDALQATRSLAAALAKRGLLIRTPVQDGPYAPDLGPQRRLH